LKQPSPKFCIPSRPSVNAIKNPSASPPAIKSPTKRKAILAGFFACLSVYLTLVGALTSSKQAIAQEPTTAQPTLRIVKIQAGIHVINAEIAIEPKERAMGLMFREKLGGNNGMLFVFDRADKHCFWMRNTPLALSIAWLDGAGKIVTIDDMRPKSDDNHCPTADALYALEMDQGWFKQKGIKAGTVLRSERLFQAKP
jgi:uncharacterized protein